MSYWQRRLKQCLPCRHTLLPVQNKNLSWKSAFLITSVSTNFSRFSRYHVANNSVAPFPAFKHKHSLQFLHTLRRRANARNVSFETPYGGQYTLSIFMVCFHRQKEHYNPVNLDNYFIKRRAIFLFRSDATRQYSDYSI